MGFGSKPRSQVCAPAFTPQAATKPASAACRSAWYDDRTITYKVGTINVDIVDAAKKQLIWEGVSEGSVSEEALANPKVTINGVVTEMMRQYPGKPNM